ncbi:hypothetical protein AQ490_19500 [Wenjunlia vitaminophila]|uniref:Subtilisin inhibitor domain-containing protein n=2 Tax=Wenjunlia vitaminophila TaxID=76728 RepID=A0A0T6LUY3_WENVI|nr:hypothetical protein AQ490_19500 [Wenjunlia vitaminophila]
MTRRIRQAVVAAVVGVVTTGVALPSTSAARAHDHQGRLWLSVVRGADPDGHERVWAVLTCGPDGGTHPDARAGCDALRAVDGDLTAVEPTSRFCTRIYAPVIAEAMGTWDGRAVRYRATFPNRCEMEAGTGPLFAFGDA